MLKPPPSFVASPIIFHHTEFIFQIPLWHLTREVVSETGSEFLVDMYICVRYVYQSYRMQIAVLWGPSVGTACGVLETPADS